MALAKGMKNYGYDVIRVPSPTWIHLVSGIGTDRVAPSQIGLGGEEIC